MPEGELIELAYNLFEQEEFGSFERCFKYLRAFGGSQEAAKGAMALLDLQDRAE